MPGLEQHPTVHLWSQETGSGAGYSINQQCGAGQSFLISGPQFLHPDEDIENQGWWHMPTVQAFGRLRQEDQEFEVILDLMKSWLKQTNK